MTSSKRSSKRQASARTTDSMWQRLVILWGTPCSGASLGVFRICVGIVMALEGYALFVPHDAAIHTGTPLERYYANAVITFHWPYEGFEWLPLLPPSWMHGLAALLCLAGAAMAVGIYYRAASAAVFSIWAYFFFVESTRTYWQSHYYLELLVCFLMLWLPAARRYSFDAWRQKRTDTSVPFWTLFLLRGQLTIAYFYAGVAKFHGDWFWDAVPVRWFLADPNVMNPYRGVLSAAQVEAFETLLHLPALAYFLAWTGAAFDVAIGFLLLFRRTRIFGLLLMLFFHATNHLFLFDDIGWFPVLGAATALIFLDPDWPERFARWIRKPQWRKPDFWPALLGGIFFPLVGVSLGWSLQPTVSTTRARARSLGKYVVPFMVGWLVWQAVLPLRHHVIPGDARFTYEGFSFSWRLKADTHHALGHALRVADSKVLPLGATASQIDWEAWPWDAQVYRRVQPGRVIWPQLPEFCVILEPLLGERIIYNPYSGKSKSFSEQLAKQRILATWQERFGREPKIVKPLPLSTTLEKIVTATSGSQCKSEAEALRQQIPSVRAVEAGTATPQAAKALLEMIQQYVQPMEQDVEVGATVRAILQQSYPLSQQGESFRPAAFFIIEDTDLWKSSDDRNRLIDRAKWKPRPAVPQTQQAQADRREPLIIYHGALGAEAGDLLPLAYIADAHGGSGKPQIRWNSMRDMTISKYMHSSGQAFYLRRYARRVADLWFDKSGRRPAVYADTAVSYNGRPHQQLVDPQADLARVDARWFAHNPWIRDLETPRIPPAAVLQKPSGYRLRRP